jgi:thiamine monophosphate synthase
MIGQNIDYTLYLVTDRRWLGERTLWDDVEEAILGGVTLVQLREKEISRIIGASAATVEETLSLQAQGADYLGGAVFPPFYRS